MKNILILLLSSLLVFSCGEKKSKSIDAVIEKGNLTEIRALRGEISKELHAVEEKMNALDEAIAKLDTVRKLPLVTTLAARDTVFKHYLELQGNVETKQNIVLYPEMAGTLTQVYVKEGQPVKKGQVLAKIDDGGLSQQLSEAKVRENLARTTFERQERLWNKQIGSEIQYLEAKANYESQKNIVAQIESRLGKTNVVAPFSGIVDNVISEQGSVVAPGSSQLIRIVNLSNMYLSAEVPESYVSTIEKGTPVQVIFPVLGKTIDAKVRQVGNYINPNNRSFTVEVELSNKEKNIKPNLTAKVKINDYTNEKAILIPQSIISENADGDQYTFVTSGKDAKNIATAKQVIVKTGKLQGDYIEITEGLRAGDNVISEGARSVKDGQKVKILNQ